MIHHPNLKLWLPMTGNSNDLSGNGLNGTDSNVSYGSGQIGGAGVFNGTSSYLTMGTTSTFSWIQNTGVGTICAWINPNNYSTATNDQVFSNVTSSANKGYALSINSYASGDLLLFLAGGVVTLELKSSGGIIADSNWHHIAACFNWNGTSYLYLDGVSKSFTQRKSTLSTGNSTYVAAVGRYQYTTPGGYFNGSIDDLQIYNITLPQTDIRRIMRGLHPLTRG
jgi:hypothetical protein